MTFSFFFKLVFIVFIMFSFSMRLCYYDIIILISGILKTRSFQRMIGINIGIAAPMAFFPFGGNKASFFGDLKGHGREIFQFFTDTKVIISRWL